MEPTATTRLPFFVTRPREDALRLVERLRAAGHDAIVFPVLGIEPPADPAAVEAAMRDLEDHRLVVFVSPNAIRHALAGRERSWPSTVAIAVLGPGSVAILAEHGIDVRTATLVSPAESAPTDTGEDAPAGRFDSEALLPRLLDALDDADPRPVLIVKGDGGRPWLRDRLQERGFEVRAVQAYRRVRPTPDAEGARRLRDLFAAHAGAVFVVTSSEGVSHLVAMVEDVLAGDGSTTGRDEARRWLFAQRVVTPHARIVDVARRLGFMRIDLSAPGDDGIEATIK